MTLFFWLRLIHILSGVMWAGGSVMLYFYVLPAANAAGPAGGAVMQHLTRPNRLPAFMGTVGALAFLAGLGLYWMDSGGFKAAWFATGTGIGFTIGGVAALAATILGSTAVARSALGLGNAVRAAQAAGGPPTPAQLAEIERQRNRLRTSGNAMTVLLLIATAMMAVSRYLP